MKFILLTIIRFYWFIKPNNRKPKCIFRKSCSCYVYDIISDKGVLKGLAAFYFRYKIADMVMKFLKAQQQERYKFYYNQALFWNKKRSQRK